MVRAPSAPLWLILARMNRTGEQVRNGCMNVREMQRVHVKEIQWVHVKEMQRVHGKEMQRAHVKEMQRALHA